MRRFDAKEQERFRKIVGVMERATIPGERLAAQEAATRLAAIYGRSLDEAILETHPERDDGSLSATERQQRRDDFHAWAAARARMTEARERAEHARSRAARAEAERRAANGQTPQEGSAKGRRRRPYQFVYRPSRYRPSAMDRFRLIAGLLGDGVGLRRTADLADASTNEVARIWLLLRRAQRDAAKGTPA